MSIQNPFQQKYQAFLNSCTDQQIFEHYRAQDAENWHCKKEQQKQQQLLVTELIKRSGAPQISPQWHDHDQTLNF
ncbi:hypothetical protein [Persicobacter psychrovividus]|uniref:Uncharacterized protein n=1 Tax=Persicobacter psychrovividus TaxID=387638 RepID=A0ABN6LFJ1_9BACT|nr:hypothetical protein PEPS_27580 [Persicobacter psychrovividus]